WREIELDARGGAQNVERSIAAAGGQLDDCCQLPLHDRDSRTQIAFLWRLTARRESLACDFGCRRVVRARGADADGEQLVGVAEVALLRHQIPSARLDDQSRAHRGQVA